MSATTGTSATAATTTETASGTATATGAGAVAATTATAWAAVMGVGVWTPGFPDAGAWHTGLRRDDAETPPARLPVRLRRRTSLLIRMVAEVAAQAAQQARVPLGAIPVIVGSAFGELTTTMEMLRELETDRALSPFRFHNSVHNTASGYLSIAHENRAAATSLAAGTDTTAMALLEAMTLLADRGGDALVIVADESLPAEMCGRSTTPHAAAMVLRAPAGGARNALATTDALAWLADLRQIPADGPADEDRGAPDDAPCLTFLRLVGAILDARVTGSATRVDLTAGKVPRWSITVRAPHAGSETATAAAPGAGPA
jgi:hypothetical protein